MITEFNLRTGEVIERYESLEEITRSKRRRYAIKSAIEGKLIHAFGHGYTDDETTIADTMRRFADVERNNSRKLKIWNGKEQI